MPTDQQPLRVLCSGTGYFSQFHYDAWLRVDGAQIVGVCNRTLASAKTFAEKYQCDSAGDHLEDMIVELQPDLLDIITPPATHLEAVRLAAKHGIDVICQKPFGEDLAQAKQMVSMAQQANIKLIVHENFRFMPWYREIKSILNKGLLGQVLSAEFKLRPGDGQGPEAYLARQPYFQKMPKFLVHETAIHLLDTFRFLFGQPQGVYAQLRRCNPIIKGEDSGIIIVDFENSIQAVFDGNRLLDHCASNTRRTMGEFEICGTKAELRLDGEARLWLRQHGQTDIQQHHYQWNDIHFGGDCVYLTIAHIVQHYQNGTPLENEGASYLNNICIEDAVYRASSSGTRQSLTEILTD